MSWVKEFKQIWLEELEKLPEDAMVSLSGGIESSCIYYGLRELGRKPVSLTFELEGTSSRDLEFTKKICTSWETELIHIKIPRLGYEELVEEIKSVLEDTQMPRSIDTQVCLTYKYCFPEMAKYLTTGFYSGTMYAITAETFVKYGQFKKGLFSEDELEKFFHNERRLIFEGHSPGGRISNHVITERYFEKYGHICLSPIRCQRIYDFFSDLTFAEVFNTSSGRIQEKWFMIEMFQKEFDRIGNHKNMYNMHVESGFKKYFEDLLLEPFGCKNLTGVFPRIMKMGATLDDFF